MAEFHFEMDLSKTIGTDVIDVRAVDELHYRFVPDSSITTAVVKPISRRDLNEPGFEESAIALDSTVGEIDVSHMAYIDFQTTTAESGKSGHLYIYTRKTTL